MERRLKKLNISQIRKVYYKVMKAKWASLKKNEMISKLLQPLNRKYRVHQWTEQDKIIPSDVLEDYFTGNLKKGKIPYLTTKEFGKLVVNKASRDPRNLKPNDPRRDVLRNLKDEFSDRKTEYIRNLRRFNKKKIEDDYGIKINNSGDFIIFIIKNKFENVNDFLEIINDPMSYYEFNRDDILRSASYMGETKLVKILLNYNNINVNIPDKSGWTALMSASWVGHTEIVRMLLEVKDINVNIIEDHDKTALMLASNEGNTEIVKMLLEKGANVNAQDINGSTALMLASQKGHIEIIKMLLHVKGIKIDAKDEDRRTALSVASWLRHREIVKMLEKHGAKK